MGSDRSPLVCDCTPVVDVAFGSDGGRPPSEAVVDAIAAAADADPRDLPPLYGSVDPEALDHLCRRQGTPGPSGTVVGFAVGDWNVFVRDDGRIRVCDPTGPPAPSPVFD